MAVMVPKSLAEYAPTLSEQRVYEELRDQLPDSYQVFYSVRWNEKRNGRLHRSEADFVVVHPDLGFICLEVKGGSFIRIDEEGRWHVSDEEYGDRILERSPYDQAEDSMYCFSRMFAAENHLNYGGIAAAAAVFPFFSSRNLVRLSHRESACTIDMFGMRELEKSIVAVFRVYAGDSFGRILYPMSHHRAFLQLMYGRTAIAAAAGALADLKERQFALVNRVQDNYIYLLTNLREFSLRGAAGTGKTWIAMKMAFLDASEGKRVLFTCASSLLASEINRRGGSSFEVCTIEHLQTRKKQKYDSVYVDEAQDASEEDAAYIRTLVTEGGRLGVFYDEFQSLEGGGNAFAISLPPLLLHENIRNTSSIYDWTRERTALGREVILNPIEGPSPSSEKICSREQLVQRLEEILYRFLVEEGLPAASLVLLTDDREWLFQMTGKTLADWTFSDGEGENAVHVCSAMEFKGLEADMVVYVHRENAPKRMNYIAYTRAKYFLHELVFISRAQVRERN